MWWAFIRRLNCYNAVTSSSCVTTKLIICISVCSLRMTYFIAYLVLCRHIVLILSKQSNELSQVHTLVSKAPTIGQHTHNYGIMYDHTQVGTLVDEHFHVIWVCTLCNYDKITTVDMELRSSSFCCNHW